MRIDRAKRYIGLGILLFMTGCGAGEHTEVSTKPEANSQETNLSEAGLQEAIVQEETPPEADPVQITEEENNPLVISGSDREDDEFYVQCLQNLYQGNSITYADGYYYFRSQTENYSLCRSKGTGMPVEVVADQVPGAIYVQGDQVYFINVSDSRTLYRVGTDGSGLEKLSDFPMQELIVVGDKIYFRSVYEREYDPFYQLTEEPAEDDRYLYSMNMDGSGCELLVPKVCWEFVTDGEQLYYCATEEGEDWGLYKNSLDGKSEEEIPHKEGGIWDILPYQGALYWVNGDEHKLVRLNAQGEEEIVASNVLRFTIARGLACVINDEKIRWVDLTTGEEKLLAERREASGNSGQGEKDILPWYSGNYNRGIFVVNGQVFARYFESAEKGVLWHILDGEHFVVFEDMEPLNAKELVRDTSLLRDTNFYYPGRADENAKQYLDQENELHYEEAFATGEDGRTYGEFSITLPKFNEELASYKQLNQRMEELMTLAMEDKDSFFEEIGGLDDPWVSWYREHEYSHLYIGEKYISMYYSRGGYEGGVRAWKNSLPLIFDRETGLMLHMDDLFTVDESVYKKRLTGAIYKYCEMKGEDSWHDAFDNNVLVKNLDDLRCYLTPDGVVLCYERYEIKAGCYGSPTFEIPYEWFADIFKQ